MAQCLRCGFCCKGHLCFVPKYETSNLSPDFLETANEDYINENIEEQGAVCKWLTVDERGLHTCLVHEKRSSMCRDHQTEFRKCLMGHNYWKNKTDISEKKLKVSLKQKRGNYDEQ